MSSPTITLVFLSGSRAGERMDLTDECTIGRTGDIELTDAEASRVHATFRPVDGGVEVLDMGSANGTFVDDTRVGGSAHLAGSGATIRIAATQITVEMAPVIAAPQVTRVRPVAETDPAEAIATPQATRARQVLDPHAAAPIATPQATRARAVPGPAEPVATPAATVARAVPPAAPEEPAADTEPPATSEEAPTPPEGAGEPEAAPAPPPKAPPKLVQKLFGYMFGGGPEKIPVRMAIVVGTYTVFVAGITVLIYALVS
jgi:pSer/pThr/pTyr-binding forkhead associated (FHA) protein